MKHRQAHAPAASRLDPAILARPPVSAATVAREFLGRSPSWFSVHRAELEAQGFPAAIPISGRYSVAAIHAWLDGAPISAPNPGITLGDLVGAWEKSA